MSKQILQIDEIDRKIINLVQKDPNLTHTEIAKRVNRSQPTVGVRVKKLEESGIIKFQAGIDLKSSNFYIGWLEIKTKFPEKVYDQVKECPFIINAFKRSGETNVCVMLASVDIESMDDIVNHHFRSYKEIEIVEFDIITDVMRNIVLPIDTDFQNCKCMH